MDKEDVIYIYNGLLLLSYFKKRWDIVQFKPKLFGGQLYIFRDSTLKDVSSWG